MSNTRQPLFIRIMKDGALVEMKQFTKEQVVLGREGNVDLQVQDPAASPIHAMIEERSGKFYLCDLGSQAGTYVGGEKIVDKQLESGAVFQIGSTSFEFHIGIPKTKSPSSPPLTVKPSPVSTPSPAPIQAQSKPAPKPPPKAEPKAADIPKDVFKKPSSPLSSTGVTPLTSIPKARAAHGTYAPPAKAKLDEIVRPGRGSVVEVILSWGDRVLATRHFRESGIVSIGSNPTNQIVLPIFGSVRSSHPLVRIEGNSAIVLLSTDMTGELVRESQRFSFSDLRSKGQMVPSGTGSAYTLQQNEYIKVHLGEGVTAIIRFVVESPEVLMMPFVDLSVNQLTSIILGLMGTAVFMFYAYLYAPPLPEKLEEEQEPPRKAQFFYKRPAPVPIEMNEQPAAPKSAENLKTKQPPAPAQGEEGASSEPKPTKNATSKIAQKKAVTKNTANSNPGAAPKVQNRDTSKLGIVGLFAKNGIQDQLNKANAGAGNVKGLSENATGSASDGAGKGVGGSALKDIGANGNGTATVGIAGVKTKGRGSGISGYGAGTLGAKKNASLIAGDSEATFTPGIDKEAIRRVVQEHLKEIKACYEKGLNRNPGLYGKIVIRWTIGPGGIVTAAGIKNTTLDSSEVETCSVTRLRAWKFPEPPAGEEAEVSYPFVFQAQE